MRSPPVDVVAAVLRRVAPDAEVDAVQALTGGASSETFAVEARRGGERWPLILQRAAGTPGGALPRHVQAELQRRAGEHGVPVAPIVTILDRGDDLGDGMVMERVEGESLAPRWLRSPDFAQARSAMAAHCGEALAALHAMPLDGIGDLGLPTLTVHEQHARLFDLYLRLGVDVPTFDLAFVWTRERLPDAPATVLVHGDFRSGNFIVGPEGLRAVLDWELAHLGHPIEELGWLCVNAWRFGAWQRPAGGFATREALYAAYEAAGGVRVDRAEAHAWEVYGTLRWGLACLQLADDHLSGRVPSVERATIGRRVSETEADILHLIRHGDL